MSAMKCIQHGGALSDDYCGPECARLTRLNRRAELVEQIARIDHWGARSDRAAKRTAEHIVDMLERNGWLA